MKTIIPKMHRPAAGILTALALLTLPALPAQALNNFNAAKRALPAIYQQLDATATIYCGCPLTIEGRRFTADLRACGYQVRKQPKRAARVEIEHVMPAWEFGHQLGCWQKGGRRQCTSGKNTDAAFKEMEGDLHNLFPAVGEVNGDRGNFQFTDWNGTPTQYGKCEMVVDFKAKQAQPPKRSRGIIARAYLYMADKYGIRLSRAQARLYAAWNRMYPPTANECRLNVLITAVQGNDNPFVTAACTLQK